MRCQLLRVRSKTWIGVSLIGLSLEHEDEQPLKARSSACAGEFINIGLSADTIHRGTTMFDLY
jgi:hypothetical protein